MSAVGIYPSAINAAAKLNTNSSEYFHVLCNVFIEYGRRMIEKYNANKMVERSARKKRAPTGLTTSSAILETDGTDAPNKAEAKISKIDLSFGDM